MDGCMYHVELPDMVRWLIFHIKTEQTNNSEDETDTAMSDVENDLHYADIIIILCDDENCEHNQEIEVNACQI